MAIERKAQTYAFYEAGESMQLAYPTFAAPQARLDFTRNPKFGGTTEALSLAQAIAEIPSGDIRASSVASRAVRSYPYEWRVMQEGFPLLQRLRDSAVVQTQTSQSDDLTSAEILVSFGFRTFDGAEPSEVVVQELNLADSLVTSHAFTFGAADLVKHPGGVLRRVSQTITTSGTTKRLRLKVTSTGQDFGITDVHAEDSAGTDHFGTLSWENDANADGVGDPWSLVSGSDVDWYGEDHAGLRQWIDAVCRGALRQFELRRPGGGEVVPVRLRAPLEDIGWPRIGPGSVSGVSILLQRPTEA